MFVIDQSSCLGRRYAIIYYLILVFKYRLSLESYDVLWEGLKIDIRDPNGEKHTLDSGDIGDFCLSALFDEITTYVTERKGILK